MRPLPSRYLCLERERVDERGLGAFDPRRDDRLLADERVDEPIERRYHLARELEPHERLLGGAQAVGRRRGHRERRISRRKRERDEGGEPESRSPDRHRDRRRPLRAVIDGADDELADTERPTCQRRTRTTLLRAETWPAKSTTRTATNVSSKPWPASEP